MNNKPAIDRRDTDNDSYSGFVLKLSLAQEQFTRSKRTFQCFTCKLQLCVK